MSYLLILLNGIEVGTYCIILNVSAQANLMVHIKTLDLSFSLPVAISTLICIWLIRCMNQNTENLQEKI